MLSPRTASGRMPFNGRAPASAPSQYGGRRIYVVCGRQSYRGLTLMPSSTCAANMGMYTLRNCSGLTLEATMASISSSDGQISFNWIALPSGAMPSTSFSISKRMVPAIAYATTSGGEARKACFAYGWMRPSKLRLPDKTAVAYRSRDTTSSWITGSSAPDMPLHEVQAKATTPKPSCSSSVIRPASCRYSSTVLEPGASDDFTHGLRVKPRRFALRAIRPAAIILRGLFVLVQLVMAAMMTAPSGILPGSFSTTPEMPRAASSEVGTRLCGFDGPAILRTTDDRSKLKTRSYSASFRLSAHKPVSFAYSSTSLTSSSSRPVSFRYLMVCSSM